MQPNGSEIVNFIEVWATVVVSLCYCYSIRNIIPIGLKRLVFVVPVVCLFLYLPLNLSSPHLGGTTAFFIAWLANFKILLFAFGKGPLCLDPNISLPLFIAVSCLPIKIHKNLVPDSPQNGKFEAKKQMKDGPLSYAVKLIVVAILVRIYSYSDVIHPKIILALYAFHIYFLLEVILAISAAMARTVLGIELEPQFNEPYLATSVQDFWGRRWNLMVTSILRPTVYDPTRSLFRRVLGRDLATLLAVFATFLASGIMHELMFYYLGRVKPKGEVTAFFVLHGLCVVAEIVVKRGLKDRWQLPVTVSRILTVGFVFATANWLFFPTFSKCKVDVKAFEEYAAVAAFVRNATERVLRLWPVHQRL